MGTLLILCSICQSTNVSWSVIVVQMTTFVMRGPRFESNYGIFTITIDQLLFAN